MKYVSPTVRETEPREKRYQLSPVKLVGLGEAWTEVPILASVHGVPVPLTIDMGCVLPTEQRYEHCNEALRAASMQNIPVLVGPGKTVITSACVLVGSGPSAIPLLPEIRARYERGEQIIALKGAHDWLVKNGIVPAAAIALDPQRARAKCFRLRRREVLYMCASQMHPDTWAHLRGYRVLIWHSRIAVDQHMRSGWENTFLVPTASTTGNSAILLLYLMGRRNFELYGFDSCLPPAGSWWDRAVSRLKGRPIKLDGARVPKNHRVIEVIVGGQRFETTALLVQPAQDLQALLMSLPDVRVNAHGRGIYQAILAEGKAHGWPV